MDERALSKQENLFSPTFTYLSDETMNLSGSDQSFDGNYELNLSYDLKLIQKLNRELVQNYEDLYEEFKFEPYLEYDVL